MKLEEKIKKIVRKVLNEELGINSQVVNACDDIMEMIITMDASQLRDIPVSKNRHYPCKAVNIDYPFVKDKVIRLNICIYDFPTEDDMMNFKLKYPSEYRKMINAFTRQLFVDSKITIRTNIVRINGKINGDSYNALQHELEHAFQRIMSGRITLVGDYTKYSKNIEIMSNSQNEFLKKAAKINYYSYKSEQDAFENGLYAEVKVSQCTVEQLDNVIKGTKFYAVLTKLKKIVNDFSRLQGEEREKVEKALQQEFHYDIDKVIKRGEKVISRFIYIMGRVKTLMLNSKQDGQLNEAISSSQETKDIEQIWMKLIENVNKNATNNEIKYDNSYRVTFYKDNFNFKTISMDTINIEYLFYIVNTISEIQYYRKYSTMLPQNCEADYDDRKIIIRGFYIKENKTIYKKDTYQSLFHEFHHLYQYNNGFTKTSHQKNLYELCVKGINNPNPIINNVSNLIYHTFKHEISAAAAETFQKFSYSKEKKSYNDFGIDFIQKSTPFFQEFKKLIIIFEQILADYKDADNIIENYFGISVNMIYRRVNKAEIVFNNFFKKTFVKIQRTNTNLLEDKSEINFFLECFENKYQLSSILDYETFD